MNLENIRELREVSGTEEINALLATGKWRVVTLEREDDVSLLLSHVCRSKPLPYLIPRR